MTDDSSDFWFIVAAVVLGILFGLLVGIPLWLVTGYPQYVRIFFFLGLCLAGFIGTAVMAESRYRRKKG